MSPEAAQITRLSTLGSIAILPILILPVMVGALIDYAGFTDAQAGWMATAGFVGSALAAIIVGLRIRHLNPRSVCVFGLIVLVVFDCLSAFVNQMPTEVFVVVRFISGLGGAAAYASVVTSIAALREPERGYGMFTVLQFGLSSALFYLLPIVLPTIGVGGMFILMSLLAALALSMKDSVLLRDAVDDEQKLETKSLLKPAALLAMLGIGAYEVANFMQYTYAERIGLEFDLSSIEAGQTLGLATLLGVPAGLAVVWLGDRFGQLKPLLGAIIASVAAHFLLLSDGGPASYIISMCIISAAWAFGLAYFYSIEARLDPAGSVVVVGGFFTACGGALGPALAAMLVRPNNFSVVLATAIGVYVIVGLLMIASNRYTRQV
jgi:MFS family permease